MILDLSIPNDYFYGMAIYKMFFDGSCGPKNPGGTAAYGYALMKAGEESPIATGHEIIGSGPGMSNNLAEFSALYHGLCRFSSIREHGSHLFVLGDSKLVINVMNRWWTPKPEKLYYPAYVQADTILRHLRREGVAIGFDWVPREQNTLCDKLSKTAGE